MVKVKEILIYINYYNIHFLYRKDRKDKDLKNLLKKLEWSLIDRTVYMEILDNKIIPDAREILIYNNRKGKIFIRSDENLYWEKYSNFWLYYSPKNIFYAIISNYERWFFSKLSTNLLISQMQNGGR